MHRCENTNWLGYVYSPWVKTPEKEEIGEVHRMNRRGAGFSLLL